MSSMLGNLKLDFVVRRRRRCPGVLGEILQGGGGSPKLTGNRRRVFNETEMCVMSSLRRKATMTRIFSHFV